ncbi:MAG: hypothetical protein V4622_01690 [Bacteroidota bacterium]
MKKVAIIFSIFCVSFIQAQLKEQIWNLSLFQIGNGKLFPKDGTEPYKLTKTNHLMFELDFYSPEFGFWGGFDASFLVNSIFALTSDEAKNGDNIDAVNVTNGFNGGFFDFNGGMVFNNKRPISIAGSSTKIGMGIRMGAKGFDTDSLDRAYVLFGPEIGIITNVADKLDLFTKVTLSPAFRKSDQAFNSAIDLKATYQILGPAGLTLSTGLDNYRQKERDTYKFKYVQFGITVII